MCIVQSSMQCCDLNIKAAAGMTLHFPKNIFYDKLFLILCRYKKTISQAYVANWQIVTDKMIKGVSNLTKSLFSLTE